MYEICDNKRAIAVDLFSAAANCDLITTKPLNVLLHTLVETWDEMRFSRQSSLLCSHLISPRVWGAGCRMVGAYSMHYHHRGRCRLELTNTNKAVTKRSVCRRLHLSRIHSATTTTTETANSEWFRVHMYPGMMYNMYTKEEWIGCGQIDPYFVDRGIIHLAPSFSFIWVCLLLLRNISFRSRGDFVCAFHIILQMFV